MKFLLTSIFFLIGSTLLAQPGLTGYFDVGRNNLSEGLFLRSTALGHYKFEKNTLKAGMQLDLLSNSEKIITGYKVNAERELSIRSFPFSLQAFCIWTSYSELLRETNIGVALQHQRDHFKIMLGNNFRTFSYTKNAINWYSIGEDAPVKIYENWNLMYLFSYYLKPMDNHWNAGISLTNTDHFIINQETNPVMNLQGLYEISSRITLFSEAWYKTAGAFNLNVNYFGFFFRTGIVWDIQ